jgi:hypothetical protein
MVKSLAIPYEPLIQVQQMRSTFHPHAQRNAFRRRDARQQSRLFARENPRLRHSPNSNRLCSDCQRLFPNTSRKVIASSLCSDQALRLQLNGAGG